MHQDGEEIAVLSTLLHRKPGGAMHLAWTGILNICTCSHMALVIPTLKRHKWNEIKKIIKIIAKMVT